MVARPCRDSRRCRTGSPASGLRCRGPAQPLGMQNTAGPCLWGLRVLLEVVRQVATSDPPNGPDLPQARASPSPAQDVAALRDPAALLVQAGTPLSRHKGHAGRARYFVQATSLVSDFRKKGTFLRVSALTKQQGSLFKTPWVSGSDTPIACLTTEHTLTLSNKTHLY